MVSKHLNQSIVQEIAFREYDIRGKIDSEIPINAVYQLIQTIAYYFKTTYPHIKTIAVGRDGRIHSPIISDHVCQALIDSGFNVLFVGICPSPALYFAMHTLSVQAGIMITASHNTKEYNGFKLCVGDKFIAGNQIKEIHNLYKKGDVLSPQKKGVLHHHNIIDDYVTWLAHHFCHLKGNRDRIVIDCGNGTAGSVIQQLCEALKWPNVHILYPEVDGNYPHHTADPTIEKNMEDAKEAVIENHANLGIGFDGDCDRMGALTEHGSLVCGDKLLAIFSKQIIQSNNNATVICDIKSSLGLTELILQWGGNLYKSRTGHAHVKAAMKRENALVGGELSCHFFFADRYFGYDDGIYAMLRLIELLQKSKQSLEEAISIFPMKFTTPEIRISCSNAQTIVSAITEQLRNKQDASLLTIDGVHATLPYGWGIIRASNTQPVLSIRMESDNESGLAQLKQDFFLLLSQYIDQDILRNKLKM